MRARAVMHTRNVGTSGPAILIPRFSSRRNVQNEAALAIHNEPQYFVGDMAHGSLARRLKRANYDPTFLRTNDLLTYDDWKEIDRVVTEITLDRRTLVDYFLGRGLVRDLAGKGLGKMVIQSQNKGDWTRATVSMYGESLGQRDRHNIETVSLPLPMITKPWGYNARELEASMNGGMPLDTAGVETATRMCLEEVERMVVNGAPITYGGGTIYGLTTTPHATSVSLGTAWNTATAEAIATKVRSLKQTLIGNKRYGPYALIIPKEYETVMDQDYSITGGTGTSFGTLRDRLLQINNLEAVIVSDFLADDTVILIQLTSDVVRIINGMDPTAVEWEEKGGLWIDNVVMMIQVPEFRSDQDGNAGIVIAS